MKKVIIIFLFVFIIVLATSCTRTVRGYVEYISEPISIELNGDITSVVFLEFTEVKMSSGGTYVYDYNQYFFVEYDESLKLSTTKFDGFCWLELTKIDNFPVYEAQRK